MATPRKPRARKPAAPTTPDPIEIAMAAAAKGGATDSPAQTLLVKQARLIDAQRRNENFGSALKVLTGVAGLAIAIALGLMVWSASQARGLVIGAFSVPPSLTEKGITGEVLAREMMDELAAIAAVSKSPEAERSLAGDWTQSISLEIPTTGVSLDQLERWLRDKLGDQQRASGEVKVTADGSLRLVVRSGALGFSAITGREEDLEAMVVKAAEAVYSRDQARAYGIYLGRQPGRDADRLAWAIELTRRASPRERAVGHNFLGIIHQDANEDEAALAAYDQAIAADPTFDSPAYNKINIERARGRLDAAYRLQRQLRRDRDTRTAEAYRQSLAVDRSGMGELVGDFATVREEMTPYRGEVLMGFSNTMTVRQNLARAQAGLHDARGARDELSLLPPPNTRSETAGLLMSRVLVAALTGDWPSLHAAADAWIADTAALPGGSQGRPLPRAYKALALAHLGRMEEARALIGATPLDCQPCVQFRGQIAALAGDARTADHWFDAAVRMAPALPQANHEWGRALLARGDAAGALAKFEAANGQSPRFADPLSGWGEALLAQGEARAAIAKFREADRLAPNWGRNHLLWGEALAARGKAVEARAQWRVAERLDLTPDEHTRLARNLAGETR